VDADKKLKALVHIFDHRCVDIFLAVPEILKFTSLSQATVDKYIDPISLRASSVAWTLCYLGYKKKNPNATDEEFRNSFTTNFEGVRAFQEALNLAGARMKEKITAEDLESLYKVTEDPKGNHES
jgi:hypothetical protein